MKSGGWHFISSWTSDFLLHICYLVFASRTSHVGRYDSYGLQNWIDFYQASSKLNDFLADSPFFIICPRRVILIEVWSEYWCHSICLFVFTVIRLCILKWIDPLMYIPHGPDAWRKTFSYMTLCYLLLLKLVRRYSFMFSQHKMNSLLLKRWLME